MTFFLLFLSASFNAAASFCLKLLAGGGPLIATATLQNPLLYAALTLFGLNIVGYALFLTRVPLAVGYPAYVGATCVLVLALALIFLHENLSAVQLLGIALILLGVWLTVR